MGSMQSERNILVRRKAKEREYYQQRIVNKKKCCCPWCQPIQLHDFLSSPMPFVIPMDINCYMNCDEQTQEK